jgi:hypothetical protein
VAQRNDQIFQLSLTEIAFTITFLLLLLLGYVVMKEQKEREAAQAALARMSSQANHAAALNEATAGLAQALGAAGVKNPDDVITRMTEAADARAEAKRLRQQVEDLDAQMTAMSELKQFAASLKPTEQAGAIRNEFAKAVVFKKEVEKALNVQPAASSASASKPDAASQPTASAKPAAEPRQTAPAQEAEQKPGVSQAQVKTDGQPEGDALKRAKDSISTAQAVRTAFEQQMGVKLKPGDEAAAIAKAVAAARSYGELAKDGASIASTKKENSDLRGQVAFLKNRLDARGGRDYPPCWADENGKVEFLFTVTLSGDAVAVSPAWPARREADAKALPGVTDASSAGHTYSGFKQAVKGVFDWSNRQDPQCRHYVQLRSLVSDAVQSDRARLMVEDFFYKVEARR